MPNTIGQEIIRHPMQELGFGKFNGLCKGFTDAFIEDILQLKLNFSETIQSIQDMPDLIEKLRTFITKNEMLISFPEEKKKDFSDEDLVYKNIIKLFKIIKVYQNDLHIPFEVTEKKLNKNSENLKKVYTDEVIYTVKEWCFYLSELRDILQKEEQATLAISISLKWNFYDPVLRELIDHNVGLYYDRDNDKWWLADINFLPTPQPMLCSNLDKTTSHLLPIENNELKTIPLKIIKNGALPLLLKSLYFKDNDYIPANIRIFTQEKNPRLEQIKLKFSEFRKSQIAYISTLTEYDSRTTKNGDTIIHLAIENNDIDTVKHFKVIPYKKNHQDRTLLHTAASSNSFEVMDYILSNKDIGIVDEVDKEGATAAFLAAQNNHAEVLERLAKSGANLNLEKKDGCLPITMAAQENSIEAMKVLLKPEHKVEINKTIPDGRTATGCAAMKNNIEILELLHQAGASLYGSAMICTNPPIHLAAQNEALEGIQFLIQHKVNPDQVNLLGNTALHVAAAHNKTKAIQLLIQNGADINKKNMGGMTPLHYTITQGDLNTLKILIKLKANVLIEDHEGKSPIYYAFEEKKTEAAIILLLNTSFEKLSKTDLKIIAENSDQLLTELNKIFAIPGSGNIDKVKKLQHDISMHLTQNGKDVIFWKYTPMANLIGLFNNESTDSDGDINFNHSKTKGLIS